ncbi:MAG: GNAT family N-acetyltransferase [Acidimicrobiia bacterium]|nr:GNAT family N-acetyltransferase [Acidimicrobiia bacterium]
MTDTLNIREFADNDLDEVLEVFRAALGENPLLRRTPELFAWKHLTNPFGRSIILVAEEAGRIAGVRAFMRWELDTRDGIRLRCVRAVDTATHPGFLRRGIFKRLTMEALDVAAGDGVDLVFNTPNPKSGAGYMKMGWSEVGPIGIMVRPRPGILWGSGDADALPDPDDFVRRNMPAAPVQIPDRHPIGLRTPRTPEYLAWRFVNHPTARYSMVESGGTVAYLRPNHRGPRRELVVSDVLGPAPRAAIRASAAACKADYLAAWFSSGSPERSAATRARIIPVPKVSALTLVCRPLRELPVDPAELPSWDFALGDLELL